MASYEFKIFKRQSGGPARLIDAGIFEAPDDDVARSEAYTRTMALPPGHLGLLVGENEIQLFAEDSPDP